MNKLSVVIPASNEENNIGACLDELVQTLRDRHGIPFEIVVVDDNSTDRTSEVVRERASKDSAIRLVTRHPPNGFGRAVRSGLTEVTGEIVVIYMADLSDDPEDVVVYYHKIEEGHDCVFGSRFVKGSSVNNYPPVKLVANRIVNRLLQLIFWTRFNDLTNAFKGYRTEVVRQCGPYRASHFNITVEMSLSALIQGYSIAQVPVRWSGRTWGSSNLKLREMGRRYLAVTLKMFFEKLLIADDLEAERLAHEAKVDRTRPNPETRAPQPDELGDEFPKNET